MKTFVIADSHLWHAMLVNKGFRVSGYEWEIMESVKQLPYKSTLVHLGDVAFGQEAFSSKTFTAACGAKTKILILGNHDKKSVSWYMDHGWDLAVNGLVWNVFGKRILFSHAPQADLPGWVDINIHGHVHDGEGKEWECKNSKRHHLVSCENDGYQAQDLEKILQKHNERKKRNET